MTDPGLLFHFDGVHLMHCRTMCWPQHAHLDMKVAQIIYCVPDFLIVLNFGSATPEKRQIFRTSQGFRIVARRSSKVGIGTGPPSQLFKSGELHAVPQLAKCMIGPIKIHIIFKSKQWICKINITL